MMKNKFSLKHRSRNCLPGPGMQKQKLVTRIRWSRNCLPEFGRSRNCLPGPPGRSRNWLPESGEAETAYQNLAEAETAYRDLAEEDTGFQNLVKQKLLSGAWQKQKLLTGTWQKQKLLTGTWQRQNCLPGPGKSRNCLTGPPGKIRNCLPGLAEAETAYQDVAAEETADRGHGRSRNCLVGLGRQWNWVQSSQIIIKADIGAPFYLLASLWWGHVWIHPSPRGIRRILKCMQEKLHRRGEFCPEKVNIQKCNLGKGKNFLHPGKWHFNSFAHRYVAQ